MASFRPFVAAKDGFQNPQWWAGLAVPVEQTTHPYAPSFPIENHPRESVSWYQAIAFCRWLTAQAQDKMPDLLPAALRREPQNVRITLPTEWQWEKAARGFDGRKFPWGQEYLSGYANIDETARYGGQKSGAYTLGSTSAMGIYPQGASPFGVLDLSGNVWEWCLNEHENPDNCQETGDRPARLAGRRVVPHH